MLFCKTIFAYNFEDTLNLLEYGKILVNEHVKEYFFYKDGDKQIFHNQNIIFIEELNIYSH